jgi:hypothetical protein
VNIGSRVRLIRQSATVQRNIPPENVAFVGDCMVGTISGKVIGIGGVGEIAEPVEAREVEPVEIDDTIGRGIGANVTSYVAIVDLVLSSLLVRRSDQDHPVE